MQTKPQHILIVDDEEVFADVVAKKLSTTPGYQAIPAYSGSAAIDLLKTEKFDVILLDYKMPGVSGLNIFQWMHEQKMETPVIMFTAAGSENIAVEAMKLGAYDYVRKDHVDIEHIPHLIDSVYERYLFRKEKERLEKAEQEFQIRASAIEMFHKIVTPIGLYMNTTLAVLEMQTVNQWYFLEKFVPPERKEHFERSFAKTRAAFKSISLGIKALTDFSDIVYSKPVIEKEISKVQEELQKTLTDLQKLTSTI